MMYEIMYTVCKSTGEIEAHLHDPNVPLNQIPFELFDSAQALEKARRITKGLIENTNGDGVRREKLTAQLRQLDESGGAVLEKSCTDLLSSSPISPK